MYTRIFAWVFPLRILFGIVYVQYHYARIFDGVRNLVFDAYMKAKPRASVPSELVVVHIDEQTITEYGTWPWDEDTLGPVNAYLVVATAAIFSQDWAAPWQ